MSKQLEYIIKKVLLEQLKTKPKLVTKTALLDGKAVNFIKTEVCPKLGINPNALATDPRINGFQVVVERKGDVSVNPDETEEILYTPDQLQEDVLDYLETSIGGVWARSRSANYFWFISGDINSKDNKNEKKRATYKVVCTYVKADMINKEKRLSINSSTTGWIKTFKQGGLVFDIDKLDITDFKITPKITGEKPDLISLGDKTKQPEEKLGLPVLDLPPDKISNEILNSIIVPDGGFKVGLKDDNEFYKVQVLMLRWIEKMNQTKLETYKRLYTGLLDASKRGDYWDGGITNGATQAMVQGIKDITNFKDKDKNTVNKEFIDFLKSKI